MIYANSKGIKAHVDNIMITPEVNVKITDFGLAKSLGDYNDKLTGEISFLYSSKKGCGGTILYKAPEQFDGTCNQKSDIYSFGLVLYRLVTSGKWPFYSDNIDEWEELHKTAIPKPVKHELFPIIDKCLKKDPDRRYDNFSELIEDLKELYKKITGKQAQLMPKAEQLEAWELNNKGISLYRLGLIDEAKTILKKSIDVNPVNPLAHNNLGLIYESKGQLDKAKDKYINSLKYAPDYAHANNNLGNMLLNEGKHEEAIKFFKKAIRIDSNYYTAYFNLANTYYKYGKLIYAIKRYLDAININPNYAEAYANLGIALFDKKLFECSEWAYKKAINIKPNHCLTYFNLGNLYSLKKENKVAITYYKNFIDCAGPELSEHVKNAKKIILTLT